MTGGRSDSSGGRHALPPRRETAERFDSKSRLGRRDEVIEKRMSSVLENIEIEAMRTKSPPNGPGSHSFKGLPSFHKDSAHPPGIARSKTSDSQL